jgi:hypothetical protein
VLVKKTTARMANCSHNAPPFSKASKTTVTRPTYDAGPDSCRVGLPVEAKGSKERDDDKDNADRNTLNEQPRTIQQRDHRKST